MPPGSFWDIPLENGYYGAGIVLERCPRQRQGHTRMFLAGLLDWIGKDIPTERDILSTGVAAQGFAHLYAVTKNKGMIRGCIDLSRTAIKPGIWRDSHVGPDVRLRRGYTDLGPSRAEANWQELPVASTWGYGVIVVLARKLYRSRGL